MFLFFGVKILSEKEQKQENICHFSTCAALFLAKSCETKNMSNVTLKAYFIHTWELYYLKPKTWKKKFRTFHAFWVTQMRRACWLIGGGGEEECLIQLFQPPPRQSGKNHLPNNICKDFTKICKTYLFKIHNVFFKITKWICPSSKSSFSSLLDNSFSRAGITWRAIFVKKI